MTHAQTDHSQVIFWNIWGHRHPNALHKFMQQHAPTTDIFCLTEVTDVALEVVGQVGSALKYGHDLLEKPQHVDGRAQLDAKFQGEYQHLYASSRRSDWKCEKYGRIFPAVGFGSSLMFRHDLQFIATGENLLCEGWQNIRPRIVQWLVYEKNYIRYLVAHFHGIWIADNTKGDDPARIRQSLEFLRLLKLIVSQQAVDKIVFGGDFNLDIKTRALVLLKDQRRSQAGPFKNLIEEFAINDTRTTEYRKYDWPEESMHADHVFIGPNVQVHSFNVLNNVRASDHAPLVVRFT